MATPEKALVDLLILESPFAAATELHSFGFDTVAESRPKSFKTPIRSAFLKSNTRLNLLVIQAPGLVVERMRREEKLKVKLEVDIDPPGGFETEARPHLLPIPFSILSYSLPDLFAGKLSAVLCRQWKGHVKGRDWYDLVWLVARKTPVRLEHLRRRLVHTGARDPDEPLTRPALLHLLERRIAHTDFDAARRDVRRFVKDPASLDLWSASFFREVVAGVGVV